MKFRAWLCVGVLTFSLFAHADLPAEGEPPFPSSEGPNEALKGCIAELARGVERGAATDTPDRLPMSFAKLHPFGSAAWSLRPEQSLSNPQQRWLEMEKAFGVLERRTLLAAVVAEQLEAMGYTSKNEFRAVLESFLVEFPSREAQMQFLDGVAQRILFRLRDDQRGKLNLKGSELEALKAALSSSATSGFAELELYILYRMVAPTAAFRNDVYAMRRGWFSRFWRRVFRRQLPATLGSLGEPVSDEGEDSQEARRSFLGELKAARAEARDFFVARNLYLLPVSYLEEMKALALSRSTRALVERRLGEIEAEVAASAEVATLGILRDEVREIFQSRKDFAAYLSIRRVGASHAEGLAVLEGAALGGLPVAEYVELRRQNAAHEAAIDYRFVRARCSVATFVTAMKAGVSAGEIAAALEAGIVADVYVGVREAQLSHETVLGAHRSGELDELYGTLGGSVSGADLSRAWAASQAGGFSLASYRTLRSAGASHEEALELFSAEAEGHLAVTERALVAKIPVAEVKKILGSERPQVASALRQVGWNIDAAVKAANEVEGVDGATESEALLMLIAGKVEWDQAVAVARKAAAKDYLGAAYVAARNQGASHEEALEVAENFNHEDFKELREAGATTPEAMEVLRDDHIAFETYCTLRKLGKGHDAAKGVALLATTRDGKTVRDHYDRASKSGAAYADFVRDYPTASNAAKYVAFVESGATSTEALEALAASENTTLYAELRKGNVTHAAAVDILKFEVEYNFQPKNYFAMLAKGMRHEEAMRAYREAKDIDLVLYALEKTGSPIAATDLASRKSIDGRTYRHLLDAGFTHEEAVEIGTFTVDHFFSLRTYQRIRSAGATHAEAMEAYRNAKDVDVYLAALVETKSHGDAIAVAKRGDLEAGEYEAMRKAGYSHDEALEAAALAKEYTFSIKTYEAIRRANVTHADAIAAYKDGDNIDKYLTAVQAGATHTEAMALDKEKKLDRDVYVALRKGKVTHEEALAVARVAEDYTVDAEVYLELVHSEPKRLTSEEYLEAVQESFDMDDYVDLVRLGHPHADAKDAAQAIYDDELDLDDFKAILALGKAPAEALRVGKAIMASTLTMDEYKKLANAGVTGDVLERALKAKEDDDDFNLVQFARAYKETKNVEFSLRMASATTDDDD